MALFKMGFVRNGKLQTRYFNTFEEASKVANKEFERTGVVLGIEHVKQRKGKKHVDERR